METAFFEHLHGSDCTGFSDSGYPPVSDVRRKLLDPPHHSKNSGRPGLLYSFTSHNRFFISKNNAYLLKKYQVNLIKFKSLDWSNLGIETCFYAIPTHLQKENSQSILIYSLAVASDSLGRGLKTVGHLCQVGVG